MANRVVSVDENFDLHPAVNVTDSNLPTRLAATELSATYAGTQFKGAAEGGAVGGSPALTHLNGWPVWTLSYTTIDQVAIPFHIPAHWATFNVSILWVNMTDMTGNVRFRHDMEQVSPGGGMVSAAGVAHVVTADARFVLKETIAAQNVIRSAEFIRVKPTRMAGSTDDTLDSAIGIAGIRLTRTS